MYMDVTTLAHNGANTQYNGILLYTVTELETNCAGEGKKYSEWFLVQKSVWL